MRSKRELWVLVLLLISAEGMRAQTNRLTGSPYSLFGLGVSTSSNMGKNNGLGRGGYALHGANFINNYNPASYGTETTNSFILDVGFLGELSSLENNFTQEERFASNFSSLGFATSIDPKSTFGVSVTPLTDVGYSLIGIQSTIEGSFDQFTSNIFGTGALNNFNLSYGRTLFKNLRLGGNVSYLFGSIEETEVIQADLSGLTVQETSSYRGIRFGLGLQYDLYKKFSVGASVNFPTTLSGTQDRIVDKTLDFTLSPVENETNIELDSFDFPFEFNGGLVFNPWNNLFLNVDYSWKLWESTSQQDNVGDFVDQNVFSLGGEYFFDKNGLKYWQHIEMRAGFFHDSGYLTIAGERIETTGYTLGLGLPLGRRSKSMLNLSFSSNNRGNTGGILVEERISSININLSLKDIWFIKRKIN
ncbi:hypothetical protein [Flagellimonas allohymeniacidonis]|uniref:Aromatic hydrocarbon degradation protein n=1 Tax=Flagellimonas allohymeniacidonis TaxID=2517819 RepID=A0A4Q8QDL3_9FLAO|nr:hypothetical protein [Allomuricauda hymeniacidonis]TAI47198.1 hypothetical protein EW142_10960 [Allomuricauda hymeniacidonis]